MTCRDILKRRHLENGWRDQEEKLVKLNDQIINYIVIGHGPEIILCISGVLGTIWSDFKPQIEGLDKNIFTIVAWDIPGYGRSRSSERRFHVNYHEEDADTAYNFMQRIGFNTFSVLGWSDGGHASLILAAKYPVSVNKLVIWGTNSYIHPKDIESWSALRDISTWPERTKNLMIDTYTEPVFQKLLNDWYNTVFEIYKNGGDICSNYLKKISCPTFILCGDKDPLVAPEHAQYLASNIKGAKLYKFPQGGHRIHMKYSEEFNKLVTEFLMQHKNYTSRI